MDCEHFDTLTRTLAAGSSRRGALAALAGGFIAAFAAARGDHGASARKKGKRKRKRKTCSCSLCYRCQGGTCVPAPDGIACGECGECAAGSCVAKPDDEYETLCGRCATCRAGTCVNKPTGTGCTPYGLCNRGVCYFPPECILFPGACSSDAECCSGACCEVLGARYCCRSEPGDPCYWDEDCVEGASCVAFRCFAT